MFADTGTFRNAISLLRPVLNSYGPGAFRTVEFLEISGPGDYLLCANILGFSQNVGFFE